MKNIDEIISSTKELLDSSHDLIHTLAQADYDVDINDFSNIKVFSERLDQFWACTLVYSDFSCLIDDLELEKDRFLAQKAAKFSIDNFHTQIDTMLYISRNWNFQDYRCRNFQKRVEDTFAEIKACAQKWDKD